MVATNTLHDGHYDHSIIDGIVGDIEKLGKQLEQKHIILHSTTIPGYCDSIEKRLESCNYTLTYNTEFIRQGSIISDQEKPDMVLICSTSNTATELLLDAYNSMCTNEPKFTLWIFLYYIKIDMIVLW